MSKGQQSSKTKYFDRDWYLSVDHIKRGEFELVKVDTAINRADLFTKALRTPRFLELKDRLIGGPALQSHVFDDASRVRINLLLRSYIAKIEPFSQVSTAPNAENNDSRQRKVAFKNSQSAKPTAPELPAPATSENVAPSPVSPLANALEDTLSSAQAADSPLGSLQQQQFFSGLLDHDEQPSAASSSPAGRGARSPLKPAPSPAGFNPSQSQSSESSLGSPFNNLEIETPVVPPTASKRRLSPAVVDHLQKIQKTGGVPPETAESPVPSKDADKHQPRTLSATKAKQALAELQSRATPSPPANGETPKSPKAKSASKAPKASGQVTSSDKPKPLRAKSLERQASEPQASVPTGDAAANRKPTRKTRKQ
jgi:hypothetical protein